MTIYRDGKAIELTGLELHQAYEEVRDELYINDIGDKLREDYDIEPCTDDSEIDLKEIAIDVQDLLANDDTYFLCYCDATHTAIEHYLREKGI
jgi:hypothetical protein